MAQINNKYMPRFQFFICLFLFFVVVVLWVTVSRLNGLWVVVVAM